MENEVAKELIETNSIAGSVPPKKREIIFLLMFIGTTFAVLFFAQRFYRSLISSFFIKDQTQNTNIQNPLAKPPAKKEVSKKKCVVEEQYYNKTRFEVDRTQTIENPGDIALLSIAKNGSIEHLELWGGKIIEYDVHIPTKKLAYITEQERALDFDYRNRKVYIKDLSGTGGGELIYEKESVARGAVYEDYFLEIKDVGFSPDGKLLVVTTSTEIFTYNLETKNQSKLFEIPQKKSGEWGPYSLRDPKFSESGRFLVVTIGYYEGVGYILYDTQTGEQTQLDFSAYVSGTIVEGWYEDKLVLQTYNSNLEQNGYYLADPSNLDEKKFLYGEGIANYTTVLSGDYIYFLSYENEPSGYLVCNSAGEKYEVQSRLVSFHRLDLKTEQTLNIHTIDSTSLTEPWYKYRLFGTANLDGRDVFIIVVRSNTGTIVYSMGVDGPFVYTELDF